MLDDGDQIKSAVQPALPAFFSVETFDLLTSEESSQFRSEIEDGIRGLPGDSLLVEFYELVFDRMVVVLPLCLDQGQVNGDFLMLQKGSASHVSRLEIPS